MMRSHGWDRDLPEAKQQELRSRYAVGNFESLYNFYLPGFNLRSTDLQAFLGLRAIEKLDAYADKRRSNFKLYKNNINVNLIELNERSGDFVSNFAYPIVSTNRKDLVKELMQSEVEVRPLIAGDMSQKPMWIERFGVVNLPNCRFINSNGLYIPNHQDLSAVDISRVCEIVNKYK
jgi:CDP-6-deoxy-D-xylo-4-hexulose-3-dehydrase